LASSNSWWHSLGATAEAAMDDARALLDSIMGPSRNQAAKEEKKNGDPDFADRKICKNFLVGFCPHDWFTVNKRQLEPCTKVHSEFLRSQFEAHPQTEKYRNEYEDMFLSYLEKVVGDCDKFIARERIKCRDKGAGGKQVRLPPAEQERIEELEAKYAKMIKEAEEKAEESVSKSGELTEQAMAVKDQMDAIKTRHTHEFPGEEVCEICGVRYALAGGGLSDFHGKEAHLNGKTHEGYTEIRAKVAELRGQKRLREREKDKERERDREKEREKRKEKDKDRDRDRDRDKEAADKDKDRKRDSNGKQESKGKGKEKDRSRGRSRSESKAKDKAKAKDREADKDKAKDRGRSKSKEKEKEKERAKAKNKEEARSRSRSRSKDKKKAKGAKKPSNGGREKSPSRSKKKDKDRRKTKGSSSDRSPSKGKKDKKSKGKEKQRSPSRKKRKMRSSSGSS